MNYSYKLKEKQLIELYEDKNKDGSRKAMFKIDKIDKSSGLIKFDLVTVVSSIEKYKPGDKISLYVHSPNLFGIIIHEIWAFVAKIFSLEVKYTLQ